jgi:hypothetical protein
MRPLLLQRRRRSVLITSGCTIAIRLCEEFHAPHFAPAHLAFRPEDGRA